MFKELTKHYGRIFEEELLREINQIGAFKEVKEGQVLIKIGQYVKFMPLLVSGVLKVMREDTNNKELLLYFLQDGHTNSIKWVWGTERKKSRVKVVAETDAQVIMLPAKKMTEWLLKYKSWGTFVLSSYDHRMNELLDMMDSIAFLKMDERLLKHLKERVRITKSTMLYCTHQEIADDLNTPREVVSRLLKKLENMGKVKLQRNQIEILDSKFRSLSHSKRTA
ncbi:Crp/Fnr family transcriptional regulator [Maribacter sp. ACAM166]|uniref:Crp/Fnr family transcriptional regulator n=1 Tax=Maribacter sp. ACAM166 TaxID=2508996 RepID=UPI0010FD4B5A|nr:Crp/Fnr family transcriptional regulator [Maribacter sp. ACAM166]TLP81783.1 Crp/Fnr family transcriptional regulator [Maribacter sp. ACAM166]